MRKFGPGWPVSPLKLPVWRLLPFALVLANVLPSQAMADRFHGGLNLRVDSGAHPIRLTGGYQFGNRVDASLTIDPMFFTDGQNDIDALLHWSPRGYSFLTGWRTSLIDVGSGTQKQQKLILGLGGNLPDLGCVHSRWSFELATLVVRHGGGLPSKSISFATGRDFIDLINFGMFVTVEWGRDR